jgi:hypothetical protein
MTMRNVRSSVLLLSVFLLMAGTVLAQDPGNRDTVRVAKVTTNAGQKVGVPVTVYNDEDLGGYSLGFMWNSNDVSVDSISYIGTRLIAEQKKVKTIDNASRRVLVGMYDLTGSFPLGPGDGMVFKIWFTVAPGAPDQFVTLDSAFVPPSGRFVISTAGGVSIKPEFIKGEIKIGNPQPPPVIVLSQSSFTFSGIVGGANPPSQAQLITNGGGQALNWTATKLASWLVLTPSNGTAPSVMVVAVNTVGLAAGVYADSVSVSAPGATNTPLKFAVALTLSAPQPTIKLTPSSFSFQAQQNGANPPGKTLNITNIGLVTLNWTASIDSAWLTLSSYSGTAPSSVTVSVNSTGLPTGVYVDSIRVSDPTATNNPQYAVVTFEISSESPMILPSPTSVFALGAATENPYPHTLLIQNSGGGVMNWHLTKNHPWMSLDLYSGTASQGSPGVVALNFDGDSLDFGEYRDTITITSTNALNSPVIVPVVFFKTTVPQTLNVSTNAINMSEYECGSYPGMGRDSFTVNVELRLAPLEWTLAHRASWLTASPTLGVGTTKVNLIVSTEGLTLGIYKDTLVVNAKYAINPPETVFVSFTFLATPAVKEIGLTVDSLLYIYKYTQPGLAHQDVVIYNKPGGCLNWQATSNASWLTPIPAYGTTTQTIDVRSNAVGLSLGRHDGKVTFTADGAINSPRDLKVVLLVYAIGDANGDGTVDIGDVVYLIEYIFSGGPEPVPVIWSGDVDCSRTVDISDVVWVIEYIFSGGLAPCVW